MKPKYLLPILALALLLSGCAGAPAEVTEAPATPPATEASAETAAPTEPRTPAPDFAVYTEAGEAVRLSDYLGKPVVLNFWASWCGPCKREMPDFQEKFEELGEDVQFLIVNLTDGTNETVETASAFIAEQGYTFPVRYDTAMEATYAYGIQSIPTTFFIDEEGYVIAMASGAIDGDTLGQGIDLILP